MITYDKLARNPSAFRSLTGMDRPDFDKLHAQVEQAMQDQRQTDTTRRGKQTRQRKQGAGRKYANDLRTRLLMVLFWLRVYPSYSALAYFFSVDKSTICRNIKEILDLLQTVTEFALERPSPERKKHASKQAVMDAFPDVLLVLDGKEQRIRRPKSKRDAQGNLEDTQKPYYSGKKKCHTLKNEIAVLPSGEVGSVSDSFAGGANHDLTVTRKHARLSLRI